MRLIRTAWDVLVDAVDEFHSRRWKLIFLTFLLCTYSIKHVAQEAQTIVVPSAFAIFGACVKFYFDDLHSERVNASKDNSTPVLPAGK